MTASAIWAGFVPFATVLTFNLIRRFGPKENARVGQQSFTKPQVPKRLAPGVITGAMCGVAVLMFALFFVLRGANHLWAALEGPSLVTQYAPQAAWGFLPLFACISVPLPFTLWFLKRVGRREEAESIHDSATKKAGYDSFRVLKWLSIGTVGPLSIATLLAIPIHLSITDSEVRVGHYGSFHTEIFPFKDAQSLTIVDGYKMVGVHRRRIKNLIVLFHDGRRLRGNQVGDAGTSVRNDVMELIIAKTGLTPGYSSVD